MPLQSIAPCCTRLNAIGYLRCNTCPPKDTEINAGIVPKPKLITASTVPRSVGALNAANKTDTIIPQGINPSSIPIRYWSAPPFLRDSVSNPWDIYLYGTPILSRPTQGNKRAKDGKAVTKKIVPASIKTGAITKLRIGKNKKAIFNTVANIKAIKQ